MTNTVKKSTPMQKERHSQFLRLPESPGVPLLMSALIPGNIQRETIKKPSTDFSGGSVMSFTVPNVDIDTGRGISSFENDFLPGPAPKIFCVDVFRMLRMYLCKENNKPAAVRMTAAE